MSEVIPRALSFFDRPAHGQRFGGNPGEWTIPTPGEAQARSVGMTAPEVHQRAAMLLLEQLIGYGAGAHRCLERRRAEDRNKPCLAFDPMAGEVLGRLVDWVTMPDGTEMVEVLGLASPDSRLYRPASVWVFTT